MVDGAIECPSDIDTSAFNNPELFHKRLKDNLLDRVCVSMPCKIVSYDRVKHLATVKPLLNFKYANGPTIEYDVIPDVEILRMMAGGFLIDLPLNAGDTGWLIAVDRDSLDVKERSNNALPRSTLVNSYKSGYWIPDQWGSESKLQISGVDANRLVIQSKDGTQKISVGASDIHITASVVNITAPTTNISGNVNIGGKLDVVGKIKETTANVTLSTHTHKENGVTGNPDSFAPTTGT